MEILAAAGIISGALAGAAALNMAMTRQEEMARGQAAAIRYGETIARLWQLGVNPSDFLLTQSQGAEGSTGYNPMTYSISTPTTVSLGDDGGIPQGSLEQTSIAVTYLPYGSSDGGQATVTLDVLRPPASHR